MASTSHSLIQSFFGKDISGTGSHVFATAFAISTLTLHVVQSYFSTSVANFKHVPVALPAQSPIPTTPTATRPLTPTRSTGSVDASADVSYVLFGLVLVLIGIFAGASATYIRTKSGNISTPHDSSSSQDQDQEKDQDQDQDPPDQPPNTPPQLDEGPHENNEDRQDSTDEEPDDGSGDPDDESGTEVNGEEGNSDIDISVGSDSPGGDPDDPSGSSNMDEIPPHFEPDSWDIFALILLYIFAATTIMERAFRKRFVLNALVDCLRISAISIKAQASKLIERALQEVDDSFFWIIGRRNLMGMDNANMYLHNGTHKLRKAAASLLSKLNMTNELRELKLKLTLIEGLVPVSAQLSRIQCEVERKPTLIEGLLSPISSHLSEIPSSIPPQNPELPELIAQTLPQPIPIPDSAVTPPAQSFIIQPDTEAESDFVRIVRAVSGWGTVILLIHRVVREWRQRRSHVMQSQPRDEIEVEDEDKDEGEESTTMEVQSNSNMTLAAHGDQREDSRDEEVDTCRLNGALDTSFVTAQEVSGAVGMKELSHEYHPVPPMIRVSPSSSVPSTPEPATTYPIGTPSFVGVLTSSTLRSSRAKEDEPCSASSPTIRVLGAPTTPEPATTYADSTPSFSGVLTSSTLHSPRTEAGESRAASPPMIRVFGVSTTPEPAATTYPIGTPSFSDVLTSSTFRPAHTQEAELRTSPGPSFTQYTIPTPDPSKAPSSADATAEFAFTFQSPRRISTNPFMITSRVPTLQSLSLHDASFSLSPVMLHKRRRLDEAGRKTIRLAAPYFSTSSPASSPAAGPSRRWPYDEAKTPIRNMYTSVPRLSLSNSDNALIASSPSFDNVFCSPALQRSRRRHVEETKKMPLIDRNLLPQSVSRPTGGGSEFAEETESEIEGQPDYDIEVEEEEVERKGVSGVETEEVPGEQTREVEDYLEEEEDMDIEREDFSVIHDFETEDEQAELTPRLTPTSADVGNSFTSEGDQTILDPEIIAQGAATMLRLMQEEMEREKTAKEEAARERRAGKMKMRESRESSRVQGDVRDRARNKYAGLLEGLKREERVQVEFAQDPSSSAVKVHHTPL